NSCPSIIIPQVTIMLQGQISIPRGRRDRLVTGILGPIYSYNVLDCPSTGMQKREIPLVGQHHWTAVHHINLRSDYNAAIAAASSTSTETRRETPGSCMVTPIRCSAFSMAILLWVM